MMEEAEHTMDAVDGQNDQGDNSMLPPSEGNNSMAPGDEMALVERAIDYAVNNLLDELSLKVAIEEELEVEDSRAVDDIIEDLPLTKEPQHCDVVPELVTGVQLVQQQLTMGLPRLEPEIATTGGTGSELPAMGARDTLVLAGIIKLALAVVTAAYAPMLVTSVAVPVTVSVAAPTAPLTAVDNCHATYYHCCFTCCSACCHSCSSDC